MKALFDKDTNLVGWITKDRKNIFDLNLNWIGFVANDNSVWTVKTKSWVGILYGYNVRDNNGKTLFWNPETPIENSLRPLRPLTPLGGWSNLTWNIFNNKFLKIYYGTNF